MSDTKKYQIKEIDVVKLLYYLWDRKLWAVSAAIIMATLSILFSIYFITPLYRADFTVFINNRSNDVETQLISSADMSASQSLTYTYSALIKNRSVLEAAAKKADTDYSYEQLKNMVKTDIEENTQLINIHVTTDSRDTSLILADKIAEIAPGYVEDIIEGTSMKIVSDPVASGNQVYPDIRKNGLIGGTAGLVLTMFIFFVRFVTDTKVNDISELEYRYGLPVVGTIPSISEEEEDD